MARNLNRKVMAVPREALRTAHTTAPAPAPGAATRVKPPAPTGRLPAGWTQHYSPVKNKWYFYHKATGTSTYDKPDGDFF